MPPKKGDQPKAAKVNVDKTFGMKNKKGGAAQKQIKAIQAASASAKTPDQKKKEAEKLLREKEKTAAEQARKEVADLFKPVQIQKVPFGVDPKTILCQFFKKGNCEKGVYTFSTWDSTTAGPRLRTNTHKAKNANSPTI